MAKYYLLTILFAFSLISGCGGGGDSSVPPKPEVIPEVTLSGIAMLGPIVDADINIYSYSNGKRESLSLGSSKSDNNGEFNIPIKSVSKPLLICATNGSYIEEASNLNNKTIVSLDNNELCSIINFTKGKNSSVTISFYTHVAYGLAGNKLQKNVNVKTAIDEANLELSNWVGFDIINTQPSVITDPTSKPNIINNSVSDELRYGFANAAISRLMKWVSNRNNESEFLSNTSILFAKRAYEDIYANDGYLDGNSENGQLAIGLEPINADLYRNKLALNILFIAASPENKSSLSVDNIFPFAELINNNSGSLFFSENTQILTKGTPQLEVITPKFNEIFIGKKATIKANITDVIEITKTNVSLLDKNNNPVQSFNQIDMTPNEINSIDIEFDSTAISDGDYTVSISATNMLNITTTISPSIDVAINNTSMTAVIDKSFSSNPINGTSNIIRAIVTDSLPLQSVEFQLDNNIILQLDKPIDATVNVNKISTTLDSTLLKDGSHTIKLIAKSTQKNRPSAVDSSTFNIDNTNPTGKINGISSNFVYTLSQNTQVNFNLNDPIPLGSTYRSGILKAELRVGGTLVSSILSDKITSLSFNPLEVLTDGTRKFPDNWMLMSLLVFDNANNSNLTDNTKDIIIGIDGTQPIQNFAATSIQANTWVNKIYIEGTANDNPGTGISKTKIFIDNSATPIIFDNSQTILQQPINSRKLTQNFIESNIILTDGLHNFRIISTDFGNNVTETIFNNVGIDTIPPGTTVKIIPNTLAQSDIVNKTVDCDIEISSYETDTLGTASGIYKQEIRIADSQNKLKLPITKIFPNPGNKWGISNIVKVSNINFPVSVGTTITKRRLEVTLTDRTGEDSNITRDTSMTGINSVTSYNCLSIEVTTQSIQVKCIQAPCPPLIITSAVCNLTNISSAGVCGP